MADTPTSTHKGQFGFLSQKVGPLPLWVWIAAGIGGWYFISKKGGSLFGKSASSVPNQQVDPAGNIGTIDPATGYVYGTPEDDAALAANNASGTSTGGGTSSGTQTFTNNQAWGQAAESYLVSVGVNPTDASQAITLYLASQALTSQQQADVNLAISIIGPPPQLPGPAQVSSSTTTPPSTTPTTGTCPSGYTFSTTQTGAPGEIAASGGTGWCELNQATATTPPPATTPPATTPPATTDNQQYYFYSYTQGGQTWTGGPYLKSQINIPAGATNVQYIPSPGPNYSIQSGTGTISPLGGS